MFCKRICACLFVSMYNGSITVDTGHRKLTHQDRAKQEAFLKTITKSLGRLLSLGNKK